MCLVNFPSVYSIIIWDFYWEGVCSDFTFEFCHPAFELVRHLVLLLKLVYGEYIRLETGFLVK